MGIYIYSLRAKTVQLTVGGANVTAHTYKYAYKSSSIWRGDYGYNGYKLTEANTERNAHMAMGTRTVVPYVIIDNDIKGDKLDGATVYANVTSPLWWDCDKFPGDVAGWIKRVGRSYVLTDRTEWSTGTQSYGDGVWVNVRTRGIMIDGKCEYQTENLGPVKNPTTSGVVTT
jgi:hypothetical protein